MQHCYCGSCRKLSGAAWQSWMPIQEMTMTKKSSVHCVDLTSTEEIGDHWWQLDKVYSWFRIWSLFLKGNTIHWVCRVIPRRLSHAEFTLPGRWIKVDKEGQGIKGSATSWTYIQHLENRGVLKEDWIDWGSRCKYWSYDCYIVSDDWCWLIYYPLLLIVCSVLP